MLVLYLFVIPTRIAVFNFTIICIYFYFYSNELITIDLPDVSCHPGIRPSKFLSQLIALEAGRNPQPQSYYLPIQLSRVSQRHQPTDTSADK